MASGVSHVSSSEFAADATSHVRHVQDTGEPVVVTEDGEPAAVLVSAAEFAELRERSRFVATVEEGLDDVAAERTMTTAELKRSLEKELGPIAWR
jgi:prevent-host-death family protein